MKFIERHAGHIQKFNNFNIISIPNIRILSFIKQFVIIRIVYFVFPIN